MDIRVTMMKKNFVLASACFFVAIVMISCVSALSLLILERDISAYPGQIIDTQYRIQNMLGNGNITMKGSFSQEVEIASFPQGSMVFVPDQSEITVPVRYRIPENAPVGKVYDIGVRFETVGGESMGTGNVGFVQNIGEGVRIRIVEKPKPPVKEIKEEMPTKNEASTWVQLVSILLITALVVLIIAAVVALIYLIYLFLKKSSKE